MRSIPNMPWPIESSLLLPSIVSLVTIGWWWWLLLLLSFFHSFSCGQQDHFIVVVILSHCQSINQIFYILPSVSMSICLSCQSICLRNSKEVTIPTKKIKRSSKELMLFWSGFKGLKLESESDQLINIDNKLHATITDDLL